MDARTLAALALTILLWASAFPVIRIALRSFDPGPMALLRFAIASTVLSLAVAVRPRERVPLRRRDVPRVLLAGVVGIAGYALFLNIGQLTVDAGSASLLVNTAPIWTSLLAAAALRERPRWNVWAGLVIGFAGAALIALRHEGPVRWETGAFWVLGAAWAHSLYIVVQKSLMNRYGTLNATRYAMLAGTVVLLPFGPALERALRAGGGSGVTSVAYLGIFPAAIAYATWGLVLKKMPASRAVVFLYLVPAVAFLLSWWWLGEVPTRGAIAGGVLIVAGAALVNARSGASATGPGPGGRGT